MPTHSILFTASHSCLLKFCFLSTHLSTLCLKRQSVSHVSLPAPRLPVSVTVLPDIHGLPVQVVSVEPCVGGERRRAPTAHAQYIICYSMQSSSNPDPPPQLVIWEGGKTHDSDSTSVTCSQHCHSTQFEYLSADEKNGSVPEILLLLNQNHKGWPCRNVLPEILTNFEKLFVFEKNFNLFFTQKVTIPALNHYLALYHTLQYMFGSQNILLLLCSKKQQNVENALEAHNIVQSPKLNGSLVTHHADDINVITFYYSFESDTAIF